MDEKRTIETALKGDGFLFDGTNWHHYIASAMNAVFLINKIEQLEQELRVAREKTEY